MLIILTVLEQDSNFCCTVLTSSITDAVDKVQRQYLPHLTSRSDANEELEDCNLKCLAACTFTSQSNYRPPTYQFKKLQSQKHYSMYINSTKRPPLFKEHYVEIDVRQKCWRNSAISDFNLKCIPCANL